MLAVPWLTQLAGIAYDEGGFLLFGALAIGWAIAAVFDTEKRMRLFALARRDGRVGRGQQANGGA